MYQAEARIIFSSVLTFIKKKKKKKTLGKKKHSQTFLYDSET